MGVFQYNAPTMRRTRTLLILLAVASTAITEPAKAGLIFDVTEGAGTVEVTLSGSIDLGATLGFGGTASNTSSVIRPHVGVLTLGAPVASAIYDLSVSAWMPFGPGNGTVGTGSGDRVALFASVLALPFGYSSGASLSATGSYLGTFDSLGLTPGTYITTFENSSSDSVTVNVVPEPSWWALLFTGLGASVAVLRKR